MAPSPWQPAPVALPRAESAVSPTVLLSREHCRKKRCFSLFPRSEVGSNAIDPDYALGKSGLNWVISSNA